MASDVERSDPAAAATCQAPGKIAILFAILFVHTIAHASAAGPAAPIFTWSGFGALGLVYSDEENADFAGTFFVPKGAGFTRQLSPEVDSKLGVQLTGNFTPRFSATVQLVAEQQYDGKYMPHAEWANIKYQFTPEFSVRLGRIALATFLVSDSRKVGYANPWVRPPSEVYGLIPVSNSDGVDVSYRLHLGEFDHNLQGSFGRTNIKAPDGSTSTGRDQWVISDTVEYGSLTLRGAYQQVYVSFDGLHDLFDVFRQFGAQGDALADRYDPNGKRVSAISIGAMYDPGAWFAMAEWGTADFRSVIGKRAAWYTTAGYRIHAFTPYATYAQSKAISNTTDPGLNLAVLPPPLVGPAVGLNAVLNAILGSIPVQQTLSAGARWDIMKNADFKLQYDRINLGAGSAGVLSNVQPDFVPGGTVNLFTATFEFVW